MQRLTARYSIQLDECLMIKRSVDCSPTFTTKIDEFEITISITSRYLGGFRSRSERLTTLAYYLIEMSVTGKESDAPPIAVKTDGVDDHSGRLAYFRSRREAYAKIAAEALCRFFLFFRHRLHEPLLEDISHTHPFFQNPQWVNEAGADVGQGEFVFMSPELLTYYGVIPLQKKHDRQLQLALQRRLVPRLHEELISDAQVLC